MSATRTGSLLGQVVHESTPECQCCGLGVMLVTGARGSRLSPRKVVCSCAAGKFVAVMGRAGVDVSALYRR